MSNDKLRMDQFRYGYFCRLLKDDGGLEATDIIFSDAAMPEREVLQTVRVSFQEDQHLETTGKVIMVDGPLALEWPTLDEDAPEPGFYISMNSGSGGVTYWAGMGRWISERGVTDPALQSYGSGPIQYATREDAQAMIDIDLEPRVVNSTFTLEVVPEHNTPKLKERGVPWDQVGPALANVLKDIAKHPVNSNSEPDAMEDALGEIEAWAANVLTTWELV